MSIKAVDAVLDHSRARGNDRMVLVVIAECANHEGKQARPDFEAIRRRAGDIHRATAIRCIQRLEELGELRVDRPGKENGRSANRYEILCMNGPVGDTAPPESEPEEASQIATPGGVAECDPQASQIATPGVAPVRPVPYCEHLGGSESSKLDSDATLETAGGRASNEAGDDPPDEPTAIDRARQLAASLSDHVERTAIGLLADVAEARRLTTGWDPTAALDMIRGEFRNRDIAAEAERFRSYYSPGGLGENRPFANLTARWREWLKRAPTLDTLTANASGGAPGRRRRRGHRGGHVAATGGPTGEWIRTNLPDLAAHRGRAAHRIVAEFLNRHVQPEPSVVHELLDELGPDLTADDVVRTMQARERAQLADAPAATA